MATRAASTAAACERQRHFGTRVIGPADDLEGRLVEPGTEVQPHLPVAMEVMSVDQTRFGAAAANSDEAGSADGGGCRR